MGLAISMARWQSPVLAFGATAGFWIGLTHILHQDFGLSRHILYTVPLGLLYYLTFIFLRSNGDPFIFFTDTSRFLAMASHWGMEDRHFGWSIFGFFYHPLHTIGMQMGIPRLGREILYLQAATAGMFSVALLHRLLSGHMTGWNRLLLVYFFGLSLSVWVLATTPDTYIFSAMFLMILLGYLQQSTEKKGASWWAMGLCTAGALAVSLENIYFIPLVISVTFLLPGYRYRSWRIGAFIASAILAYGMLFGVFSASMGEEKQQTFPLMRHVREYSAWNNFLSPSAIINVTGGVLVTSVSAQPRVDMLSYWWTASDPFTPQNIIYYSIMTPLLIICLSVLFLKNNWKRFQFLFVTSVVLIVGRHAFMIFWIPQENLLFSIPSIAAITMLLAIAIDRVAPSRSRMHLCCIALLSSLNMFLLVNNGWYLLSVFPK